MNVLIMSILLTSGSTDDRIYLLKCSGIQGAFIGVERSEELSNVSVFKYSKEISTDKTYLFLELNSKGTKAKVIGNIGFTQMVSLVSIGSPFSFIEVTPASVAILWTFNVLGETPFLTRQTSYLVANTLFTYTTLYECLDITPKINM